MSIILNFPHFKGNGIWEGDAFGNIVSSSLESVTKRM
ncbi:hypothetical protein CKL83_14425 [Bacillus anthracis]|uniref:Uncharacterized protein n=3 Tax=Bacillus cereus group TaxID=86661 RepID=A0A6H3ADT8_BACAN|nr:hypothetical protein BA_3188 [Bacillus anthracis str. Ames]AAT32304.1 hypothetical protein GBAA_3188 [Bacillus anthracis str. 'Ames Ancestor']AIM06954.1 hypothetical protein BACvac02_3308 [Bacillus anthracis]EDR20772.1 hypothetical protein BAC_3213 [Bacillus anthracis str. A0488]EDR90392.1 hypothetical protein BAQ_3234 [Bacillus anthracis str. A0193]EDR94755.1 hypothetical protein BAH_3256 [Bacillus anthracis str. A0442]EDS98951.1 hypothetical protein BAK_3290 [Bacillus anthracis str. A038